MARIDMAILIALSGFLHSPDASSGPPHILSGYRDLADSAGNQRSNEHAGVDFGATLGDPVLAAADGVVMVTYAENQWWCANGIRLWHEDFNRFTHYCYLSDVKVREYDRVTRGQVMASVGTWRGPSGVPKKISIVHFDVSDYSRLRLEGGLDGSFDPIPLFIGCFDSAKTYPTNRFVLTYPLACREDG